MIIPVRCMTCGKVLADKWEYYKNKSSEIDKKEDKEAATSKSSDKFFEKNLKGKILDDLGLHKMCCRRHMLGHVDLIEII